MKRILVPVDGSEPSCRAARFAAELAKNQEATVTLLHVYDAPTAAQLGLEALTREQVDETLRRVARGSFDAAERAIGDLDVPVREQVVIGHPAEEIVAASKSLEAELIVMGTRGLRPARAMWMGSVSQAVLRSSPSAVTVVR